MYMCGNMHISTDGWRGCKSVSDPLRLRLQAAVRCLTKLTTSAMQEQHALSTTEPALRPSVIFKNHCTFCLFFYLYSVGTEQMLFSCNLFKHVLFVLFLLFSLKLFQFHDLTPPFHLRALSLVEMQKSDVPKGWGGSTVSLSPE